MRRVNPSWSSTKRPTGSPEPFFDRTREVWVAPWRKPNGKVGRPTGKTRALAVASRDRHVAKSEHETQFGDLAEGFNANTTVGELSAWWLEHVARHRVRPTSLATYRKHASVIDDKIGSAPVCDLRAERVTTFVSDLLDEGSASRAKNVRTPITPDETQQLIAECDPRFAAAAALCFVQGWRISEALGLAWQDLDLDEGVGARPTRFDVRRSCGHGARPDQDTRCDGSSDARANRRVAAPCTTRSVRGRSCGVPRPVADGRTF